MTLRATFLVGLIALYTAGCRELESSEETPFDPQRIFHEVSLFTSVTSFVTITLRLDSSSGTPRSLSSSETLTVNDQAHTALSSNSYTFTLEGTEAAIDYQATAESESIELINNYSGVALSSSLLPSEVNSTNSYCYTNTQLGGLTPVSFYLSKVGSFISSTPSTNGETGQTCFSFTNAALSTATSGAGYSIILYAQSVGTLDQETTAGSSFTNSSSVSASVTIGE